MIAADTLIAPTTQMLVSAAMLLLTVGVVVVGLNPLLRHLGRQEEVYDRVLRGSLLMEITPRQATLLSLIGVLAMMLLGYIVGGNVWFAIVGGGVGVLLPNLVIKLLRARRLAKLDDQIVSGVQTLASGVRAGLNLVQSIEMVARDGASPLRQEFSHMLREYEYGVSLEEAMGNAARRIGSPDYRLLFSALLTHRERGGDLGMTLDRISESIREIQRLENRVKTLTAQGRANARFLTALVGVVMLILYIITPESIQLLFEDDIGKVILALMVVLVGVAYIWIRKIIAIDI